MSDGFTYKTEHRLSVFGNRDDMGRRAAETDMAVLRSWVEQGAEPVVILAAAASQKERAEYLAELLNKDKAVAGRCVYFHMDENIERGGGLMKPDNEDGFGHWLIENYVRPGGIPRDRLHLIADMPGTTPADAADGYSALLEKTFAGEKARVAVLAGIGITGHFAYCDPGTPAADVLAAKWVDVVELDQTTRMQELTDFPFDDATGRGFRSIDDVQTHAVTMTMRALTHGKIGYISLTVPNSEKAVALRKFWFGNPGNYMNGSVASAIKGIAGLRLEVFADDAAAHLIKEAGK
ncbi:MAG TPA: hypothetical protein PLN69_03435 [bacterium]|nr:hypothetical protein [bacterium]